MNRLPEWITAVATAVTAAGLLLLWIQLRADHERSRRENAITYLFEWSRGLIHVSSLARRLAEGLDEKQSIALANEHPIKLTSDKKDLVLGCLAIPPAGGLKEENNEILLGEKEVAEIRWQLVRYLNILESIFVAVRHNVADKDILIEQFGYLVSPKEGRHLLKRFRDAMGTESYPALNDLEKTLEKQHNNPTAGKKRII